MIRLKLNPNNPQEELITRTSEILKRGGIIVYPTDTIYGMGCDIFQGHALKKIIKIKGRKSDHPMSFICAEFNEIIRYAEISALNRKRMESSLPGPYTYILKGLPTVPQELIKKGAIGVRLPDNKICLSIVKKLGHPIISTSVNRTGYEPLNQPDKIEKTFGSDIDLLIDVGTMVSSPSTVIDLTTETPVILRP